MEHDIRESLPIIRMTIVDEQETIETVSLRQLHNWLKIDTRFNDWMARRVQEYAFEENHDFYLVMGESGGGRPAKEYYGTVDMAKELCLLEKTELGKIARKYFIQCEKELRHLKSGLDENQKKILKLIETYEKLCEAFEQETLPIYKCWSEDENLCSDPAIRQAVESYHAETEKIYESVDAMKAELLKLSDMRNGHVIKYEGRKTSSPDGRKSEIGHECHIQTL